MPDDVPGGMARGLFLRDRDRDPLATFRAAASENFTSTARLLAGAEPVGPLAALIMWLVGTLHDWLLRPGTLAPGPAGRWIDTQGRR